jgi:putative alpha-1,2-mannosidase
MMYFINVLLMAVGAAQLTPLVDTFIGTGGREYGVGGSPPGAQVPFGALRLSPDTSLGPVWIFFE